MKRADWWLVYMAACVVVLLAIANWSGRKRGYRNGEIDGYNRGYLDGQNAVVCAEVKK